MTEPTTPPPLSVEELRLLSMRERRAADKRAERKRAADERATAATAPNASGYVVAKMPGRMSELRRWYRAQHDAYSKRLLGPLELAEVRRSFTCMMDSYKAGAVVRQSYAALRAAIAQERIADVLAAVEHGGAVVGLLARLRSPDGLLDGQRRPLPPRALSRKPDGAA